MPKVPMHHPTLPGRVIYAPEQTVAHHERAGWVCGDAPTEDPTASVAVEQASSEPAEASESTPDDTPAQPEEQES